MKCQWICSWLSQPIPEGLKEGKAITEWQEELALSIAKFKALNRATSWLYQTREVAIKLCQYPLLGYCLTELTNAIAQTTGSHLGVSRFPSAPSGLTEPGQESHPRKTPSKSPVPPCARKTSHRWEQGKTVSLSDRQSQLPTTQLPRQVNRELLSHLASQTTADGNRENLVISPQTATPLKLVSPALWQMSTRQSSEVSNFNSSSRVGKFYPPPAPNSKGNRDWWTILAGRVEQLLHQTWHQLPDQDGKNLLTSLPRPERTELLSLANQGKLTLDGARVTQESLAYWTRLSDVSPQVLANKEGKSWELSTSSLPLKSSAVDRTTSSSPSPPSSIWDTLTRSPDNPGSEYRLSTNPPQPDSIANDNFSVLQDNGFSQPEQSSTSSVVLPSSFGLATSGKTAHFVPETDVAHDFTTSLTESEGVSSLLSTLAYGEGNQSPQVSSTPMLDKHHRIVEPPNPEENLPELAAQIQRILDEEARRYGIDV